SLHVHARSDTPDTSALMYSSLRLPSCMIDVNEILLGQLEKGFEEAGYVGVTAWERVSAPARRRRMHFDGKQTLAAFIASRSDIDDMVPIITAYQIEWNKMHRLLQGEVARLFLNQNTIRTAPLTDSETDLLASVLSVKPADLSRILLAWGSDFMRTLHQIAAAPKSIGLRLISGSQADYRRATRVWWRGVHEHTADDIDLDQCPVYFVSSNTHSMANLLSGFALRREKDLIHYIRENEHRDLLKEYDDIRASGGRTNVNNFLYYTLKKYMADAGDGVASQLLSEEREIGIHRIPSEHGFDVEAQVIQLNHMRQSWMDERLCDGLDVSVLQHSDAYIINIDYPLGMAAYELLNRVSENVRLLGVYVMGKAATLNGRVNDVMVPNVVHDEHSQNTYMFNNCFAAHHVAPYMTFGSALDNQKAITVQGTFLQNSSYMSLFYKEGYTDIEMEAGPYLSSIYESWRPKRHPYNEIVNLYGVPFDIGVLHYASDTPLSKGHNLGTNLSYAGVDPTYATAIAILRRIIRQESDRLRQHRPAAPAQPAHEPQKAEPLT
ncbi:MAG: hypothetical protein AAF653_02495, partial [Chloroflexota bacterium]